ncbi:hypothetical protein [Actinomadura keratinilytica]|uniref:Uncharacterized protein n=1 Tax=Actinomadura keratinilytica TaxID=547461 RepID=A0ABP7Y485_9ACTN
MTRTAAAASQRRHGLAGLLVALFVVAGLLSSYGLGHGAPLRVCTQHALSVPSAAADAQAGGPAQRAHSAPPAATPLATTLKAPVDLPPLSPAHACLGLAVLISLVTLALAVGRPRTRAFRVPRGHRILAPPATGPPSPPSLAALQVLRL